MGGSMSDLAHTRHLLSYTTQDAADCGMTGRWQLCLCVYAWSSLCVNCRHMSTIYTCTHTHTLRICTYFWQSGYLKCQQMCVCVCIGAPYVSIGVFICACVSVWVFNMVVKCLSGPISHLPSTQIHWHAAKANRHKDRAEGITMQLSSAVCPDPVWGPLLSVDSNELPWV